MDCARRRIRHKRHYGQRIDTTFSPPNILARDQLNPYLQAARRKDYLEMCPLRAPLLVSQRQNISLGPPRANEVWVRGVPSHPYLCQEWRLRETNAEMPT